jgi:hypothetical protein
VSTTNKVSNQARNPQIEEAKLASAAVFFRGLVTDLNGDPPTEDQVAEGARKIARGMPPYWDSGRKRYL